MSVYLAKHSTSRPAGTVFQVHGVNDQIPAKYSELLPRAYRFFRQRAYDIYQMSIGSFLSATSTGRRVPIGGPSPLTFHPQNVVNIIMPPMSFTPVEPLSADRATNVLNVLAKYRPEKEQHGKDITIIFSNPDLALATKLSSGASPVGIRPTDLSPSQMQTAYTVLGILGLFLRTQTYSAKILEPETTESDEEMSEEKEDKEDEAVDEAHITWEHETLTERDPIRGEIPVEIPLPHAFSTLMEAVNGYFTTRKWPADRSEIEKAAREYQPVLSTTVSFEVADEDKVYYAKPSPLPLSHNILSVASVPNSSGLVFPWFDRMMVPDREALPSLFQSMNLPIILDSQQGRAMDKLQNTLEELRRLSSTLFGSLLTHMFTGMSLALSSQARMVLLVEAGEYLGFCLLGTGFSVQVEHRFYNPVSPSSLSKAVRKLSSHTSGLEKLAVCLSALPLKDSEAKVAITAVELRRSSDVMERLIERDMNRDQRKEIEMILRTLRFSESFATVSLNKLTEMFSALCSNPEGFYKDQPCYLSAGVEMHDPLYRCLAIFGPEAPSPISAKGIACTLPKLSKWASTDNKKLDMHTKNMKEPRFANDPVFDLMFPTSFKCPTKVTMPTKNIRTSFGDWKKFFAGSPAPTMILSNERAAYHRCFTLGGGQAERMLKMLSYAYANRVTKQDKGKKRARDEDKDTEAESSSKRPKFNLDDILDEFKDDGIPQDEDDLFVDM